MYNWSSQSKFSTSWPGVKWSLLRACLRSALLCWSLLKGLSSREGKRSVQQPLLARGSARFFMVTWANFAFFFLLILHVISFIPAFLIFTFRSLVAHLGLGAEREREKSVCARVRACVFNPAHLWFWYLTFPGLSLKIVKFYHTIDTEK